MMSNGSCDSLRKGKFVKAPKRSLITRDAAEHVAVQALSFIAGDPEQLGAFLSATGIGPDKLRGAARQPEFLAGVLNFLAADEQLLLRFAEHAGFEPVHVGAACRVLGGDGWERDVP